MRCAIVIPVYNHEATVAGVVRQSLELGYPVFVVDDGSTDNTYEKIQDIPGAVILRHSLNRGKGAALLTGFAEAAKSVDWAVTLDADAQHRPDDIPKLLAAVPEGTRPIVVGRREGMHAEHVPWASRFGRKFSNFWVRAAGGPAVSDTQSGMRLYPLPETLNLPVRARRFQFEVEVLVKAGWYGISVQEAPIHVSYAPKNERISHYRGFVDFMRNSTAFMRLIFGRFFFLPFIYLRKKFCKVTT
jgi:glycosyltransferase involved in cell wall biosynthesis